MRFRLFFCLTIFSKNVPFPRKPRKTVSVGWGECNLRSSLRSFFLGVLTVFFLAISEQNNGSSNNFDFVQYTSSVSQKFYLAFLNWFLIDIWNFLSVIDNTGLIDKKSKKLIFHISLINYLEIVFINKKIFLLIPYHSPHVHSFFSSTWNRSRDHLKSL